MSHLIPGNHVPTDCPGGRKIPWSMENPIDNIIIALSQPVQPILNKLKVSPNLITFLGVIVRLFALYHLSTGEKELFFVEALFSYFLDCLDGNYARNYNMCTVIGDYFDHFSDLIFHLILAYFLFFKSKLRESSNFYFWFLIILVLGILLCWHFGYQERHYPGEGESQTLNHFKRLTTEKNKHLIKISRFFGCGTFILIIYSLLYFY